MDDGRLFAVQMDPLALRLPPKLWLAAPEDLLLTNELRCYDTRSGAVVWRTGGRSSPPSLRNCWFFTAPTVSDGRAYVLAVRVGRLHALCLDAATGGLLWDSPIGAIESRQEAQRYAMEFFLADTSPPAVADGVAVYPTGQGIVCALNAHDGRTLWVARYPRSAAWIGRLGVRLNVPSGPWAPRQPLLSQGLCVLAPMDSRHLVAFALRSGEPVWQAELPQGVAVLGEAGGRLYVQQAGVTCLEVGTGKPVWQAAGSAPTVGIGALGGDAVYLPERAGVRKIDAATGQRQELLAWPPGAETTGNLLLLEDALVACSPERLSICPAPSEALAAAEARAEAEPGDYRSALLLGVLRAHTGDGPEAVGDLERALALAQATADGDAAQAARRQAALSLADLAVRSGASDLLDRASELAADYPAALAELAAARLNFALQQDPTGGAAVLYLGLCRRVGMLERPDRWSSASLWTELAGLVRRQCAGRPQVAEAWQGRMHALIEARATGQDAPALAEIARWAPFPGARAAALLHLGALWEQMGQAAKARRALAQVLVAHRDSRQAAEEAARGLERLFKAAGKQAYARDYIEMLGPGGVGSELEVLPTDKIAWSVPGRLVPPRGSPPRELRERALVLGDERLKCVDVSSGEIAWETELPQAAKRAPSAQHLGHGYPAYAPGTPDVMVALRSVLFGIGAGGGALIWEQEFAGSRRSWAVLQAIPRFRMIQRARRGMPVPLRNLSLRAV
ncbi:MAG: PQQ-like beta-propeller repeat protein, partial [Candidatus Brocadiae bacterium]|nr:PQQ-like beta-propeller repeat protein [Candidatus Brocadiia bacterium]